MRLFGSDKPCRVFPLMPLKINSWTDEVNGVLVWVLTAAATRELVLEAGPARSSKGPPSVTQAPSELNRLVCWLSEPAGTHTLSPCRNGIVARRAHTEVHVHADTRHTEE